MQKAAENSNKIWLFFYEKKIDKSSVSNSSKLKSALFFAKRRQKAPQNVFSKSATILF